MFSIEEILESILEEFGSISSDMPILTGTPSGVAFQAPGRWQILKFVAAYVGLGFLKTLKIKTYIKSQIIEAQKLNTKYLAPKDHITARIEHLGRQKNQIY